MTKQINPGTLKQEFIDLGSGLAKSPPGEQTSLVVGGTLTAVSALVAELDGYAAAYKAVEAAEEAHKVALAAREAIEAHAMVRRTQIRAAIKGTLGGANPALLKYGMSPDKPPHPLSAAALTLKVARAKATRAARHTMGKKQKAAIKGEVPPPASPAKTGT